MEIDDEIWPDLVGTIAESSDKRVEEILIASARQLRFGEQRRRDLHRYVVEVALAELAERGKR